jgi:hypothetical protein
MIVINIVDIQDVTAPLDGMQIADKDTRIAIAQIQEQKASITPPQSVNTNLNSKLPTLFPILSTRLTYLIYYKFRLDCIDSARKPGLPD